MTDTRFIVAEDDPEGRFQTGHRVTAAQVAAFNIPVELCRCGARMAGDTCETSGVSSGQCRANPFGLVTNFDHPRSWA